MPIFYLEFWLLFSFKLTVLFTRSKIADYEDFSFLEFLTPMIFSLSIICSCIESWITLSA